MKLIEPNIQYFESYQEAIKEYQNHNIGHTFLGTNQSNVMQKVKNDREGIDLPVNYVKATHLWFVSDDYFIGEISIRHSLTESLQRFGGHIGYGIRYSMWNKGYGTKMLSLALEYVKNNFDFKEVLITCNHDNYGSARVIEKNGGVLQDIIENNIGGQERLTRRYWIKL